MLSDAMRERLADPAYLDLHLAAIRAIRGIRAFPWYDAHFLQMFEATKRFLAQVRPDALQPFSEALDQVRTPRTFAVRQIENLFSADVQHSIRQTVASLPQASLELHEVQSFGRNVVHDHPYFLQLQQELLGQVSELVGCEVEAGYNFLSLYGNMGKCAVHMDHPISMYTLDYCIDQSAEWPIYFSDVVDWPTADLMNAFDGDSLIADPAITFTPHVLKPNNAILFSGSSQWHYRKAMAQPGFCNLLFFHYYPKGCRELVYFANWPTLFNIPELAAICDVFAEAYPDQATR